MTTNAEIAAQGLSMPDNANEFNLCPDCSPEQEPWVYYVGKYLVGACHTHQATWDIGYNLLSFWQYQLDESGGDWDRMLDRQREEFRAIEGYEHVDAVTASPQTPSPDSK